MHRSNGTAGSTPHEVRAAPASRSPWQAIIDDIRRPERWHATTFGDVNEAMFRIDPTRIASGGPGRRLRHQQAASLLIHSSGTFLVTCRWDDRGDAEGDATNEQALYVSQDAGTTWTMANDGEPIVTLRQGSSFDRPSAITHSFAFEADDGRTWLYYTVNQPYTWGADQPDRSTGGGEIRRILLHPSGQTWTAAPSSEVVWHMGQPVSDGRGGVWEDVRLLCLNGITRLRDGTLLMPVAGRATVDQPNGAFWRLNRCWVLTSRDGGRNWHESAFIGGSDALALCEPTVFETERAGHVVALMRVQYDTGNELYRSDSLDGGRTWSAPQPTGLPNTAGSGVKPYAINLGNGVYALLQTNEHLVTDRTNVSLFLTDDTSLRHDHWPVAKVVSSECARHWLGSGYGWLAAGDDVIHAVWVSYVGQENHLNYARLLPEWVAPPVIEPLAPSDDRGNDLPYLRGSHTGDGRSQHLAFPNTRSRAHLPRFAFDPGRPQRVKIQYHMRKVPRASDFHLLDLRTRNGRTLAARLAWRMDHGGSVWLLANLGWTDTGMRVGEGGQIDLDLRLIDAKSFELRINDTPVGDTHHFATADPISTVYLGGNTDAPEACDVTVASVRYGTSGRDAR